MLFGKGGDRGWAFPTEDSKGRVVHIVRVQSDVPGKGRELLPAPHCLRHTFLTAATTGRRRIQISFPANHAMPRGSITRRYLYPSVGREREAVEWVTVWVLGTVGGDGTGARSIGRELRKTCLSSPRVVITIEWPCNWF